MVVPYFLAVENKSGLTVTKAVFQLIDQTNGCKREQSFHGAQILQIVRDKGTELFNQELETAARRRGSIHLATSPAHQPQSNGLAARLVGLAKQTTRRLLLARRLPNLELELRHGAVL